MEDFVVFGASPDFGGKPGEVDGKVVRVREGHVDVADLKEMQN
jgi:hypothetical protein